MARNHRRLGAPLPTDPHERIRALREEIATAAAEVRRIRKWWRDPYWFAARLLFSPLVGAITFSIIRGDGGSWLLSFLAGIAILIGMIAGPQAAAECLARADLRVRRLELRHELQRLPREEQYRVIRHFNRHPDPDTNRIVAPLFDELRAAFPELATAAAPDGEGNEPAPS